MISIFEVIVATDLIGAAILFIISYYSLKAYKKTSIRVFLFLSLGFLLLAAGRISHSIVFMTLSYTRPVKFLARALSLTSSLVTLTSEILAYSLIAIGYSRNSIKILAVHPAIFMRQIFTQAVGEIMNIFLLLFIVFRSATIYLTNKKRLTLTTLLAFIFLLVSHTLKFISLFGMVDPLFLFSKFVYFIGLLFFLAMLLEVEASK